MLGEKSVNAIGEGVISNIYEDLDTLSREHDKAIEAGANIALDIKVIIGPCPEGNQMDIKSKFNVVNQSRRIVNERQTSFLEDNHVGGE